MANQAARATILKLMPPPESENSYKRVILFGLLGIVFGLIGTASFYWFIYSRTHIATNNAYLESDMWPINSRIMGYVKYVPVDENQKVKKGQILTVLDDSDLKIELAFKTAKYKKASADFKRAKALNASHILSDSDRETAEANLTVTKADLDGTLLKMEFTKVISPIDGILAKQSLHPGQFVQPGQNLMLVVANNKYWIKANYKETQLANVHLGMPADIILDAYPGVTWRGFVEGIYPVSGATTSLIPPENATGNFTKIVQRIPVKISITPKAGYELRPGMSVVSTIILK